VSASDLRRTAKLRALGGDIMAKHTGSWLLLSLLALGCSKTPAEQTTPSEQEPSGGAEERVQCGGVECAPGEICCNPSCGICTVPDGMCTQQFCDEGKSDIKAGEPLPPAKLSCDNVRCAAGTHCELVQVQCIRAPCDPVPECKPDVVEPATQEKPNKK
jgi:hypothetical protein